MVNIFTELKSICLLTFVIFFRDSFFGFGCLFVFRSLVKEEGITQKTDI